MSIQGLIGLPGHGKSYSSIELFVEPAVLSGRKIVTNIPLNIEALSAKYPDYDFDNNLVSVDLEKAKKADLAYWESADNWPLSGLYILDELWRIWPAGMKASAVPTFQLAFIKEHRHRIDESGIEPDIVFVTQNLGDIASCVREMVETTIICTKLTSIGAKNNFRRDYYQGAVKGLVGPKMAFIRSDQCKYKPEVFNLYKSHTKSVGNAKAIDNKGVVNATIFNGLGFKAGLVFLICLIGLIYWSINRTVSGVDKIMKKEEPTLDTTTTNTAVAVSGNQPAPQIESKTWRLSGVINHGPGKPKNAMLTDGRKTIKIDYIRYCRKEVEELCEYRGEVITRYTGNVTGDDSSFFDPDKTLNKI